MLFTAGSDTVVGRSSRKTKTHICRSKLLPSLSAYDQSALQSSFRGISEGNPRRNSGEIRFAVELLLKFAVELLQELPVEVLEEFLG